MPLSRSPSALERGAEVVLGHGPLQRHALAGSFLERRAIGGDGLLEARGAALALAELLERVAEVALRRSPIQRHALAGSFG